MDSLCAEYDGLGSILINYDFFPLVAFFVVESSAIEFQLSGLWS